MAVKVIGELKTFETEWKICNFFDFLPRDDESHYRSPSFSYDGANWHLGIYPNGLRNNDSVGYIDLYLYRESEGPSISVEVSVAFKVLNGVKVQETRCIDIFVQHDVHEFLQVISKDEFFRRMSELIPFGDLTIVCSLKKPNFAENAKLCSSGQGVRLGDIPEIKAQIQKAKNVRALYRVLFFQWCINRQDVVGQILQFDGFPFDKSSYEYTKRQHLMEIMPEKTLLEMCDLLSIRKKDKKSNIRNILNFLLKPYAEHRTALDPSWQSIII